MGIHSASLMAPPWNGATKTSDSIKVTPAENAIHLPSREKPASITLNFGRDTSGWIPPASVFHSDAETTVSAGLDISKLEPSGDQSQTLKQPEAILVPLPRFRSSKTTPHCPLMFVRKATRFSSAERTGR